MNITTQRSQMGAQDFLALGLGDVAYVRPVAISDGETTRQIFSIHTADGSTVGAAESRELAFAAVRQNGLEPLNLQ